MCIGVRTVPLRLLSGQTIVVRCFWQIAEFAAHACASVIYEYDHAKKRATLVYKNRPHPLASEARNAAASNACSSWVRGTGRIVLNKRREGRAGLVWASVYTHRLNPNRDRCPWSEANDVQESHQIRTPRYSMGSRHCQEILGNPVEARQSCP